MIIAIAGDNRIYDKMVVLLNNLYKSQPSLKKIYCVIEDDELPGFKPYEDKPDLVKFININESEEFNSIMEKVPDLGVWGKMTCARLYFPKLLSCDKIIYLDVDTFVRKPLDELWELDMTNYYIAGVQDFGWYNFGWCNEPTLRGIKCYINAGVLVMNLKKMREDNLMNKFFLFLTSLNLSFPDQHVLNLTCNDKIYYLDTRYNPCFLNGYVTDPVIYHGTQYKPWDPRCEWHQDWKKNISI